MKHINNTPYLVVIHTDNDFLDPVQIGKESVKNNVNLFDRIVDRIKLNVDKDNAPFYLACSDDPDSTYAPIKKLIPEHNIFPSDIEEKQFLKAKESLINFTSGKIQIVGVAYEVCVGDFYHLLIGEDGPTLRKQDYQRVVKDLGWDQEKFESIFNIKLDAEIIEDLTDKMN
ncbi:hypothetical protein HQ529_05250 [Candidatus Woesearchaeota archaeon]|nr:hypothetical protein [Candidatus Woesearchaeota archaeon]